MRLLLVVLFVVAAALALTRVEGDELPAAVPCVPAECQLPNCRCSSTDIPGGLEPKDTPQFVVVTFNDHVSITNINQYRNSLYGYVNPNGCYATATFFVPHEYNDYMLTNELFNYGMEIGLHSITHNRDTKYWEEASVDRLTGELADQRRMMSHFANIPIADIQGIRQPYLQMSGNNTFVMMKENGLTYDMTWTTNSTEIWPYTTDYLSIQECNNPPCPTASVDGTWVVPISYWLDADGQPCATLDTCELLPDSSDDLFHLMVENFERHYLGSRAPFSINIHPNWFMFHRYGSEAYRRLLTHLRQLDDVYVVSAQKLLEWTKNPIPLSELKQSSWSTCVSMRNQHCNLGTCQLSNPATQMLYWMINCASSCPAVYPWINNPLGVLTP